MVMWVLAPLGVLCAYIVRPAAEDVVSANTGNTTRTRVVFAVACAAMVPGVTIWALLVGAVVLIVMAGDKKGPVDLASPAWNVLGVVLALIAIVGGLAEQIATGFEKVAELADWMGPPVLTLIAALCTALSDGTAMAVLSDGTLDRAASLRTSDLRFALAAGIAVGGLGPLIAAGSVRHGVRLWFGQVLLTVIWLGVWACL